MRQCRLVASHIARSYPPPSKPSEPNALDGPVDVLPGAVNEDRGVLILTSSVSYMDGQAGQTSYASSSTPPAKCCADGSQRAALHRLCCRWRAIWRDLAFAQWRSRRHSSRFAFARSCSDTCRPPCPIERLRKPARRCCERPSFRRDSARRRSLLTWRARSWKIRCKQRIWLKSPLTVCRLNGTVIRIDGATRMGKL